ncbi:uncharacterized protein BJ212DRAFT_1313155 [Suillus subaureus]|uniref:Uncharacterized protein n=1 Tax=Suillus subaureus TaxID=48587 RepID=A0A9P7EQT7_9AGAM|nr:uncharacterized protein BJ212DRAFT_1313155 [Suillus subaureus]KAG1827575.1 hypothetical protein BJ212DRAFT_1313155 [Suillus subaureus]
MHQEIAETLLLNGYFLSSGSNIFDYWYGSATTDPLGDILTRGYHVTPLFAFTCAFLTYWQWYWRTWL